MEIIELTSADLNAWDERALTVPEITNYQLSAVLHHPTSSLDGFSPIYLIAKENDCVVGQTILLVGCDLNRSFADSFAFPFLKKLLNHLFPTHRLLYGPIIFKRSNYYQILEAFVKYLDTHTFPSSVSVRNIMPPIHDTELDHEKTRAIYEKHGFTSSKWGSFITQVDVDIKDLWRKIGKESRSKVRKAKKQGVSIIEVTDIDNLERYYRMSLTLSKRNGLPSKAWNAFLHCHTDPNTKIFLSVQNGITISGQMALTAGKILILGAVTTSNYAIQHKVPGNDLMQWHVLEWAHNNGYHSVDSVGVSPDPSNQTSKEAGIYNFKKRWGGELVCYYSFSKVYNNFQHSLREKSKLAIKAVPKKIKSSFNLIRKNRIKIFPVDRILSATSHDGISFQRDTNVCIETKYTMRPEMFYFPDVRILPNGNLEMFFHVSRKIRGKWKGNISYATLDKNSNWSVHSNLKSNTNFLAGFQHVQAPRIVEFCDETLLYFCARKEIKAPFFAFVMSKSTSGEFSDPRPLLFDFKHQVEDFCFYRSNNTLRMYFCYKRNIHSAVSENGLSWKMEDGARIQRGQPGMTARVDNPSIVEAKDGLLRLYYRGAEKNALHCCIYSAISENGLDFSIEDGIRMNYNGKYERHGVGFPNVIKLGDTWKMFYTGYWGKHLLEPYTIFKWS